jgi:DNA-binding response OmpR family regulator
LRVPQKILVVEDDGPMRLLFETVLEGAGYEVIAVSSVDAAKKVLAEQQPDALIADVRLEGENGLQLVATSRRHIPSIMVTGMEDAGLEHEAHDMGAEYLVKPVSPALLLSLLEQKLGPRS